MKRIFPQATMIFLLFVSCQSGEKGASLATRSCAGCHAFVEPSMLDKKTWESVVFPEMAFRMGLDVSKLSNIDERDHSEILRTLPNPPLVSEEQYEAILKYYTENAPDSLVILKAADANPLTQFTVSIKKLPTDIPTLLTMLRYDHEKKNFFVGNRKGKLYQLSNSLSLIDSFQLDSPPSQMIFGPSEKSTLSCMGIMDPNDQREGSILRFSFPEKRAEVLVDSLKRPVHFQMADLNNDGKEDLLVSEFGNFTGALSAYEKNGEYAKRIIHNFPGTRKTIVRDFNDDGLPDIMALITQGDERLALFTNRGDFRFAYQVLLKFSPVFGSSFIDLADFNDDGHPDILYTNGDNADYSPVLKPYHGVRIFMNDGKNAFTESWFHQMHGASMARATDFDKDGDLDIAAISFFPDFKASPEHSFIYFENSGGTFVPHATSLAASARWITMEIMDMDDDDDVDIVLAALTFPNGVPKNVIGHWKKSPASFLILKNNLH